MGTTRTPKYRIEYRTLSLHRGNTSPDTSVDGIPYNVMAWIWSKAEPTQAQLMGWITTMNLSMEDGGCNAHLSKDLGYTDRVTSARIVRQADAKVITTATI